MKVLIYSRSFSPAVGGLETVMRLVAEGLLDRGHSVVVATDTMCDTCDDGPLNVVRGAGVARLWSLARQADVVLTANISLRALPSFVFSLKPQVVIHHGWYRGQGGCAAALLKEMVAKSVNNAFVSQAVAQKISAAGVVIYNSYDDHVFRSPEETARHRDLVFLGRLVSDKGLDDLLKALVLLGSRGIRPSLTVIGEGPEERATKMLVGELGLAQQVEFAGVLRGGELASRLQTHRVMVIPSTWEEPFGVVALEGIAAGCMIVAYESGGLPEAIGQCGLLAHRGDVADLAAKIATSLQDKQVHRQCTGKAASHLKHFSRKKMLDAYDRLITSVVRTQRA